MRPDGVWFSGGAPPLAMYHSTSPSTTYVPSDIIGRNPALLDPRKYRVTLFTHTNSVHGIVASFAAGAAQSKRRHETRSRATPRAGCAEVPDLGRRQVVVDVGAHGIGGVEGTPSVSNSFTTLNKPPPPLDGWCQGNLITPTVFA